MTSFDLQKTSCELTRKARTGWLPIMARHVGAIMGSTAPMKGLAILGIVSVYSLPDAEAVRVSHHDLAGAEPHDQFSRSKAAPRLGE